MTTKLKKKRIIYMKKLLQFILSLSTVVSIISCRAIKDTQIRDVLYRSNCNQQNLYKYDVTELPVPLHQIDLSSDLTDNFDRGTLNVANAVGILELIDRYIKLRKKGDSSSMEARMDLLELRQQLDHMINSASIEISAISSEMDCEEERISQVANYLSGRQGERESIFTKGAIVLGALGAILTGGVIKNEGISNTVGIVGGIGEAGLGLLMLFNKESVEFHHERNALRDVWNKVGTSQIFPPMVWYYLSYSNPNIGKDKSLREEIIEKWTNLGQINQGAKDYPEDLYFGKGGKYTSEELYNRADMYDQLESSITLMKQDLKALSLQIDRL